jgi:hypothetical protein
MTVFQDILNDLIEASLGNDLEAFPPYSEEMDIEQKFDCALRSLLRAKQLNQRTIQLLNAYYIGKLLEKDMNIEERSEYHKRLSRHYQSTCPRMYYLFEFLGPAAILKTKRITLTMVRKLKIIEYQELVNQALIFSGAENFGGE